MTALHMNIRHTFGGGTRACLCPQVEIVDNNRIVDCYIKDAQSLIVIVFSPILSVPWFCEV